MSGNACNTGPGKPASEIDASEPFMTFPGRAEIRSVDELVKGRGGDGVTARPTPRLTSGATTDCSVTPRAGVESAPTNHKKTQHKQTLTNPCVFPRRHALGHALLITQAMRRALLVNIEVEIDLLDLLDGDCETDAGAGDEDCCSAGDDAPVSGYGDGKGGLGDPDDAEPDVDDEDSHDAEQVQE